MKALIFFLVYGVLLHALPGSAFAVQTQEKVKEVQVTDIDKDEDGWDASWDENDIEEGENNGVALVAVIKKDIMLAAQK